MPYVISARSTAVVAVLSLVSGTLFGTSSERARCSVAVYPSARFAQATYLLGSATPDTLLAGPGNALGDSLDEGRSRDLPPIHGQVIRVDRFGGADSSALASAFARTRSNDVVIVPWSYDPACRTAVWRQSTRWVPLGAPGTFVVRLRPQRAWAEGLPTFDAFMADRSPYPLGRVFRMGYRGTDSLRTGPALTAAEYFDLYRALPDRDMVEESPEEAVAVLTEWENANPGLATTYPAPEILLSVRRSIDYRLTRRYLQGVVPPVAGTWRLAASLDGGPQRRFYARTHANPVSLWSARGFVRWINVGEPYDGYYMLAFVAWAPESLPAECGTMSRRGREGYIAMLGSPDAPDAGREQWAGSVELDLLTAAFPGDTALRRFARQWSEETFGRSRGPREMPARFTRTQNGALRVEQVVTLANGRSLVIRGERISSQAMACSG